MTATVKSPQALPLPLDRAATPEGFWPLDPEVVFLNHGSFGSCPVAVLRAQDVWRERLERQPVKFLARELEGHLDEARAGLAAFVGADRDNLVFVPNSTSGVNTVLRSLRFQAGDELIVTNHEYNACRNALEFVAERSGAVVRVVRVPFPIGGPGEVVEAVESAVTSRTRLALVDHITSQTGLVFPIGEIVRRLRALGVPTLVDGSHAPGMAPLNLNELGAAYYTGNCHKWICAPKGAAFLHVRPELQEAIRPLSISHGANSTRRDRSRFQLEFAWTGTGDPTAALCVPEAIGHLGRAVSGGWPAIMARNRELALAGRAVVCRTLGIAPPAPEEMIGALASLPIPAATGATPAAYDPVQAALWNGHRIEIPVNPFPVWPGRVIRLSAQLYNSLPQYEVLAAALAKALAPASA